MTEATTESFAHPAMQPKDVLTSILHQGAQRLLAAAIEAEVDGWIEARTHLTDPHGHRQIVRNGYLPKRDVQTPIGPVQVQQLRWPMIGGQWGLLYYATFNAGA